MDRLGTLDGREYYLDPATQRVFRRVPTVRECVRPGPGRKFVIADYSQIEVRLIAFLSQEPALIDPINQGRDIHSHMAALVNGVDYDLLADVVGNKRKEHPRYAELSEMRSSVKTVTFGLPYGAGPPTIAYMIRRRDSSGRFVESEKEALARAEKLIENYFGKAPFLQRWLEDQKEFAVSNGYTRTVYGRRRWYLVPGRKDPDYWKKISQIGRFSGNHPIQGTSADMLKDACRRLYLKIRGGSWAGKRVVDARLALVCHDEIVCDCAEDDVAVFRKLMEDAMTEAYSSIRMEDVSGRIYRLADIRNTVDTIVADYWSKD